MEYVKGFITNVNQQRFAFKTERLRINDGTMIKWIWYVRPEDMISAAEHRNSLEVNGMMEWIEVQNRSLLCI